MSARVLIAGCVLAACGDNQRAAPVDAAADSPSSEPACAAVFSENFAETWTGPVGCATVDIADGHTRLQLAIPSQTIHAPFSISIDLGAAAGPGRYTSRGLETEWSASALHAFDGTSCLYNAGTAAVPPGTFTLELDELGERTHGKLDVVLYVLARPYTDCGGGNIERLAVTF